MSLVAELELRLATSMAVDRKAWAERIVHGDVPMVQLLELFDSAPRTAQRFMWLLGDICELSPQTIAQVIPILFSLRHEMPFPGMRRSVAKWLWLTEIPTSVEAEAIPQLVKWLRDDAASIACKHFSAKSVLLLVEDGRLELEIAQAAIATQLDWGTAASQKRMVSAMKKLGQLAQDTR